MEYSILRDKYVYSNLFALKCHVLEVIHMYILVQSSLSSVPSHKCCSSQAGRQYRIIWVVNIFLGLWNKSCLSKSQLQSSHKLLRYVWVVFVLYWEKYCKWTGAKKIHLRIFLGTGRQIMPSELPIVWNILRCGIFLKERRNENDRNYAAVDLARNIYRKLEERWITAKYKFRPQNANTKHMGATWWEEGWDIFLPLRDKLCFVPMVLA